MTIASAAEAIENNQSGQLKTIKFYKEIFSNSLKIGKLHVTVISGWTKFIQPLTSKLYFQEKIDKNLCQIFKFKRDHML